MNKLVTLKIVDGDFETGFRIVLRIAKNGEPNSTEINGELPPHPPLLEKYENWQFSYRNNGGIRHFCRALTAPKQQVTNFSMMEAANQLEFSINDWLNSGDSKFRAIRDKLVGNLQGDDKIGWVIQTDDVRLWRLPWHLWDVVEENKFEISISASEYEKAARIPMAKNKQQVRILVILGDSSGIDTDKDLKLLEEELPSAYIHTLIHPTKEKLRKELWEQEWELLFFAGHSSSDENFQGIFQINEAESLTIDELKYALTNAIERGLKLAIFNSCDGLGLARELANLQIPATVVMREKVPDEVAQKFLEYFLKAFAKKEKSLRDAVREARERLREMEDKYACASWLPAICHNPAELMPSWRSLLGESLDEGQINKAGRVKVGLQVPTSAITSLFDWIIEYKIRFVALCLVGGVSSAILRPVGAELLSQKAAERINDGDLTTAALYLDWALKLDPNNPKAINNRGFIEEKLQEDEEAKKKFRKAKNKLNPGGCNNAAFMEIKEGNYKKAQYLLVQCLSLVTTDMGKHYMLKNLGWSLVEQQEYDEAEQILEDAIALMPDRGAANCLLAQVWMAKGDRENALTEWQACLQYASDKFPEEIEWKRQGKEYLLSQGK